MTIDDCKRCGDQARWMLMLSVGLTCGGILLACSSDAGMPDAGFTDTGVMDEDSGGTLTCEGASLEFEQRWQQWTDARSCTSNDECVLRDPSATCSTRQSHVGGCPVAIHVDSASTFDAWMQDIADGLCGSTPEACTSVADCDVSRATCAGTCITERGEN